MLLRYGRSNGWLDGQPCVVSRHFGKGRITYIGAVLDDQLVAAAADWMVKNSDIEPAFGPVPDGVEVSRRTGEGKTVFVLINFKHERKEVVLPHTMRSILDQRDVLQLELPQYGVAVLEDRAK